jgi:hypothetical protein
MNRGGLALSPLSLPEEENTYDALTARQRRARGDVAASRLRLAVSSDTMYVTNLIKSGARRSARAAVEEQAAKEAAEAAKAAEAPKAAEAAEAAKTARAEEARVAAWKSHEAELYTRLMHVRTATLKRDARTLGVSSRDLAPALGANEPEELESRSKMAHLDVWGKALEDRRGQLRIEKHTLRTQVARHEELLRGLIYHSCSSLDAQGEADDSKTLGVKARITRRLAAEHERRAKLQVKVGRSEQELQARSLAYAGVLAGRETLHREVSFRDVPDRERL